MKKVLLVFVCMLSGSLLLNAQGNLTAGIGAGLPVGNASDLSDVALNLDVAYLFDTAPGVQAGPVVGFTNSFVDASQTIGNVTVELDDVQFLPVGARGSWSFADNWTFQGDVGFAFGINSGNDGSFYYSPRVLYHITDMVGLVASYRGIAVSRGWNMFGFGVEFFFGRNQADNQD